MGLAVLRNFEEHVCAVINDIIVVFHHETALQHIV